MALSAACVPAVDMGGSSKTAVFRRFLRPGSEVPMALPCRSCPCSRKTAVRSYRDKNTCPCSASGAVSALPGQETCLATMFEAVFGFRDSSLVVRFVIV